MTQPAAKRPAPRKAAARPAVKAAAKPLAKPAAKLATKAPAKPASKLAAKAVGNKPAKPAQVEAAAKPAKTKLVRDSFTMPADEYALLAQLKQRALAAAHPIKKSELLRAGVKLLAGLGDAALLAALKNIPAVKTGRPKSKKAA
jgi:hypothetical protein